MGGHDPSCRKMLQTGCQSSKITLQLPQVHYLLNQREFQVQTMQRDRQSRNILEPEDCQDETVRKDIVKKTV
jgi:hypothetical protein